MKKRQEGQRPPAINANLREGRGRPTRHAKARAKIVQRDLGGPEHPPPLAASRWRTHHSSKRKGRKIVLISNATALKGLKGKTVSQRVCDNTSRSHPSPPPGPDIPTQPQATPVAHERREQMAVVYVQSCCVV